MDSEQTLPYRAFNRWSNVRLKANGYQSHGLISVADRDKIHAFVAQKMAEGYHVVLKREDRGEWRRLYTKKQEATND